MLLRKRPAEDCGGFEHIFEQFPPARSTGATTGRYTVGGEQQCSHPSRAYVTAQAHHVRQPSAWSRSEYCCGAHLDIITDIRDRGTTVLMVEQNALAALEMCDHAYLLRVGIAGIVRERPRASRRSARARRLSSGLNSVIYGRARRTTAVRGGRGQFLPALAGRPIVTSICACHSPWQAQTIQNATRAKKGSAHEASAERSSRGVRRGTVNDAGSARGSSSM